MAKILDPGRTQTMATMWVLCTVGLSQSQSECHGAKDRIVQSQRRLMIGLAGSHGPWISFLYFCSPISHQLQTPMHMKVSELPMSTPATKDPRPPPAKVMNTPPHAAMVNWIVRVKWPTHDRVRSCRRKMGKRPNISIENKVREKTCVVEGSREARTADAIIAELVDMEVGSLEQISKQRSSQHLLPYCTPGPPL